MTKRNMDEKSAPVGLSKASSRRQLLKNAVAAGATVAFEQVFRRGSGKAFAAETEYDVVVVGSGAAGMTAALTAAKRGLKVLVIEKAPTFGGSAARSGAGIWIRNNEVVKAAGVVDTPEQAATYLAKVVGPEVPEDRQAAFLKNGPAMISFVLKNSPLRFRWMEGYSDYYPELPGGLPNGSSIEPEVFNGNLLGKEFANLNKPYLAIPPGVVIYGGEYRWLNIVANSAKGVAVAAQCAARYVTAKVKGEKPLTMGQALAAGLRAGLLDANVPVMLNTPLVDVKFDDQGRANGVTARIAGKDTVIKARRGLIVSTGGFEHNLSMRNEYQRQPIGIDWTVGAKENTGDGILAGQRAGAALSLMDDAWWGPTIPLTADQPYFCLAERTLPGSIIVNGKGERFVNEAAPYTDVVHTMYDKDSNTFDQSSWMIFDQNYRNRYLFRDVLPVLPFPQAWYDSGAVVKEWKLEGLAEKIGVAADTLKATVERFNEFAEIGKDLDFGRGDSVYDHYYADPGVKPSACLAKLWLPPFYACKIVPGDLGTKGGMLTDAKARVLRDDGSVIQGLYAAGNASASVMGHSYAGAGSTIGPAMTFGFIAANDIADS